MNLLFSGVPVAVAVVFSLNSLTDSEVNTQGLGLAISRKDQWPGDDQVYWGGGGGGGRFGAGSCLFFFFSISLIAPVKKYNIILEKNNFSL